MNVNYFLKDSKKDRSSISAIIRFKGFRYKLAPGVSVLTEFWDQGKHRAEEKKHYKEEAQIINIQLDRFENRIKKAFEPHILNNTAPSIDEVKKALVEQENKSKDSESKDSFLYYFKEHYENADYKIQTWKKYNTTYNWLVKYEKQFSTRLTFSSIDLTFYTNFRHWILTKKYRPKKDAPLKHYSLNYFGSLIKCIKVVLNETGPNSILKLHNNTEYKNKKFKTEAETADTVYLSTSELDRIHKFQPNYTNIEPVCEDKRVNQRERKIEALKIAKNKFLIGCYTALRVSDFNRLDEVNMNTGFISIKPIKGTRKNENIIIPIHPVIREILNGGFRLDTKVSEQKINKHIKEICQLVGITEMVTIARTEGGKVVERTAPKYELVTNHTARRSGASNMFLAGIPAISIMKITGHKTERSFLKYIKINAEENARLLADHPFFNSHN
ncbi:phage integrase SAM-like domain-containing protein [uncultured Draconibacterium sp.]|uniref:phage integrase SAM-like domain-containing protein n=1 Tax=uncultured Draconibacterium sp. TaxID=1573823 RepID=UPI002AA90601|nr:phage integrase SAM-like domain-containing protein [uncultured Draconibacterium sp.]